MKILTILALLALTACHTSTAPLPGDGGSVTPADGTQYQYIYSGSDSAGNAITLHEKVTISKGTGEFFALRLSDTINHFFTTKSDSYSAICVGDLQYNCGCDNYIFPIETGLTYLVGGGSIQTPTKKNGVYHDANVRIELRYIGAEKITTAGEIFNCSKIQRTETITTDSKTTYTTIFWYSHKLGYFVKEQCTTEDGNPSGNYTRILVSH